MEPRRKFLLLQHAYSLSIFLFSFHTRNAFSTVLFLPPEQPLWLSFYSDCVPAWRFSATKGAAQRIELHTTALISSLSRVGSSPMCNVCSPTQHTPIFSTHLRTHHRSLRLYRKSISHLIFSVLLASSKYVFVFLFG